MLGLAYAFVQAGMMLAVGMNPTVKYKVPTYGVAAASFKETAPWAEPCEYFGLVVAYAQTWDEHEVVKRVDRISRPATPNAIAGYGFLVNKRVCEGKAPEVVWRYGHEPGSILWLSPHNSIAFYEVKPSPYADMPRWFEAVVAKIESEAEKDEGAARTFVEFAHPWSIWAKQGPAPEDDAQQDASTEGVVTDDKRDIHPD